VAAPTPASTTAAIVAGVLRLLAWCGGGVLALCIFGVLYALRLDLDPLDLLGHGVEALTWLGIAAAGIASAGAVARKAPDAAHGLGLGVQGAARAWRGQPAASPPDPAAGQGEP
jgi:hypothetical protein